MGGSWELEAVHHPAICMFSQFFCIILFCKTLGFCCLENKNGNNCDLKIGTEAEKPPFHCGRGRMIITLLQRGQKCYSPLTTSCTTSCHLSEAASTSGSKSSNPQIRLLVWRRGEREKQTHRPASDDQIFSADIGEKNKTVVRAWTAACDGGRLNLPQQRGLWD